MPCPEDGTAMELRDVYREDDQGRRIGPPYRAFVCPTCPVLLPLDRIAEKAREELPRLERTERLHVLGAVAVAVAGGLYAMRHASPLTAIAALLLALPLLGIALTTRFRRWQIERDRLFSETNRVWEWLADELRK